MHLLMLSLALAAPVMELVRRDGKAKTMATSVPTRGAAITTRDFVAAILDCDHYPLTASVMGVKALKTCRTLEKRPDGYIVIYQLTGGNALVSSRHYVIAMKVVEESDGKARIDWDLVKHNGAGAQMTGPYAAALNANPDAVYTPYNTGGWVYDRPGGTISYRVQSDPGGTLPGWLVNQDAVMAFPLDLLKTRRGVKPG